MTDSLIGKQLGDYQIRELLGRGGMARVYTGYDSRLDRQAAVKVITGDFSPDERTEYFDRFQREARAIARLNHPNIVGIYQFGQYDDAYYMAMAFIEGRDLRQILREYSDRHEKMPLSQVLNIARQIGSALDYAHSRGVIHRDVKPSNIMITRDGRAILTDFGLALSANEGTRGETFGSAHYIAPEQAVSSARAVPQSDLYSLGICLYEMLTGKVPFDDPSAMTVALKHLQDPPPPPRSINPALSPAIEHVLLKALDKDPNRRYPSGLELARALESAVENEMLPDTAQISAGQVRKAAQEAKKQSASKPVISAVPLANVDVAAQAKQKDKANPSRVDRDKNARGAGAASAEPAKTVIGTSPAIDGSAPASLSANGAGKPDKLNKVGAEPRPPASRSRKGIIALLLVLIVLLLGSYVIARNAGLLDPRGTPTAASAAGLASQSPTRPTENTPFSASTAAATTVTTADNPAIPNASSDLTPTSLTDAPTGDPTIAPSPSPGIPATLPATSTAAIIASDVPISPTALPSPAAVATSVTSPAPVSGSTATIIPSAVPTTKSAASSAASVSSPSGTQTNANAMLEYDQNQFDLINIGDSPLASSAVADLTFTQVDTGRSFDASTWLNFSHVSQLLPQECFQVFRIAFSQIVPLKGCSVLAGYRTVSDAHVFWTAGSGLATAPATPLTDFTVFLNGQKMTDCLLNAGQCALSIPH